VSSRLLRTHEIVSRKSNAFIIMQQVQQAILSLRDVVALRSQTRPALG